MLFLTGRTTEIVQVSPTSAKHLSWVNVFDLDDALLPTFDVYIGSQEGYSDIVRHLQTTVPQTDIVLEETVSEIFIVIKCKYVTGTGTLYREQKIV